MYWSTYKATHYDVNTKVATIDPGDVVYWDATNATAEPISFFHVKGQLVFDH